MNRAARFARPNRGHDHREATAPTTGGATMKPSRRVPALVFTVALALGVWGLAFTFTPASFSDGDVLSAAALNALLNGNFQAASDAVAGKVDLAGDSMTGPLTISSASGVPFVVEHTGSSGYAALFGNTASNTSPAVAIKNFGTGSALSVASVAGAPLFEGRRGVADPTTITINADGTIENAVGSGLPLAYGNVTTAGTRVAAGSTTNFEVSKAGTGEYRIRIAGVSLSNVGATSVVSVRSGSSPRFATLDSMVDSGDIVLVVRTFSVAGVLTDTPFGFVIFKPGS